MKRRSRGFTLMELMVVLTLAGVIAAIGVPAMGEFQRNNRITVAVNDALALSILARGEAQRRQEVISTCASANATSSSATCGSGTGWIAFVDTDSDCTRGAGETIVGNVVTSSDVNAAANGTCLSFASTGFTRVVAGQPTTFHVLYCDSRRNNPRVTGGTDSSARGVEVLATGRSAVVRTVAEIATWGSGGFGVTCP